MLYCLLELGEGGVPPTEFRIWSKGWVDTSKGRFLFDDAAAKAVMADYARHGNELPLDYAHAMVAGASGDPAQTGRAAGWMRLELREGELWATEVRWTSAASAAIAAKEWRYFSPAFLHDPKTRRIERLVNVALTNLPATYGMTPLVAHQLHVEPIDMNPALLIALALTTTASEPEAIQRAQRLVELERELLAATGKTTLSEALGVVRAHADSAKRLEVVSQELTALKAAGERATARALRPVCQRQRTSRTSRMLDSRTLIGTSRRRPAPSSRDASPCSRSSGPGRPGVGWGGPMTLALGRPSDPGENGSATRAAGPTTLAARPSLEAGEHAYPLAP